MKCKKFKIRYIFFALLAVILLVGIWWWFFSGRTDTHYKVDGVIATQYNGTTIHMYDYFTNEEMATANVSNGKFVIKGNVDTAYLARLVNNDLYFDLMIEPGKDVKVDLIKGVFTQSTPMNGELEQFQKMVSEYKAIAAQDTTGAYRELFQADILTAMGGNLNNILGVYMLKEFLSFSPSEDELDNIVCHFGTVVTDNPALQQVLIEYSKTLYEE